jgi:hypothetical protein
MTLSFSRFLYWSPNQLTRDRVSLDSVPLI